MHVCVCTRVLLWNWKCLAVGFKLRSKHEDSTDCCEEGEESMKFSSRGQRLLGREGLGVQDEKR